MSFGCGIQVFMWQYYPYPASASDTSNFHSTPLTHDPTMSVTQLSDTSSTATSTRYVITEEEHQRQVERFHARVTSMFSKPQPVIDMRVCRLHNAYSTPPIDLISCGRPTNLQTLWNSAALQILRGVSILIQALPTCTSSTLSTTVVLAVMTRICISTLTSTACQIPSHSNSWAVWEEGVDVLVSIRFPPATRTKSVILRSRR